MKPIRAGTADVPRVRRPGRQSAGTSGRTLRTLIVGPEVRESENRIESCVGQHQRKKAPQAIRHIPNTMPVRNKSGRPRQCSGRCMTTKRRDWVAIAIQGRTSFANCASTYPRKKISSPRARGSRAGPRTLAPPPGWCSKRRNSTPRPTRYASLKDRSQSCNAVLARSTNHITRNQSQCDLLAGSHLASKPAALRARRGKNGSAAISSENADALANRADFAVGPTTKTRAPRRGVTSPLAKLPSAPTGRRQPCAIKPSGRTAGRRRVASARPRGAARARAGAGCGGSHSVNLRWGSPAAWLYRRRKGDSHQIWQFWETWAKVATNPLRPLPPLRPSAGAKRGCEPQLLRRPDHPSLRTERATAADAVAHGLQFPFRLRRVDDSQPIGGRGSGHAERIGNAGSSRSPRRRLDQGHASARVTKFARSAFRST